MAAAFAGGVDRHEIECAVYDTVVEELRRTGIEVVDRNER